METAMVPWFHKMPQYHMVWMLLDFFGNFLVVFSWIPGKILALITPVQTAVVGAHICVTNIWIASHFPVHQVLQLVVLCVGDTAVFSMNPKV
jgi:hypothetical protein